MKKINSKFEILDNYFVFLFGLQLIALIVSSYFKSEIASFMPAIFNDNNDAIIKILPFSFFTIFSIKMIGGYTQKKCDTKSFQSKITGFVGSTIIILTLLVAVNIFVLLGFLLTDSYLFLALYIIQLIFSFVFRPTIKSFKKNYNVSSQDINQIEPDF